MSNNAISLEKVHRNTYIYIYICMQTERNICYGLFIVNQFECINNGNCIPIYVFLDSLFLNSLEMGIHSHSICENWLTLYICRFSSSSSSSLLFELCDKQASIASYFFSRKCGEKRKPSFLPFLKQDSRYFIFVILHLIQSNYNRCLQVYVLHHTAI